MVEVDPPVAEPHGLRLETQPLLCSLLPRKGDPAPGGDHAVPGQALGVL